MRFGEPDYRELKREFAEGRRGQLGADAAVPVQSERIAARSAGHVHRIRRRAEHTFGTDDRGRDVFARLAYGFNVSLTFALLVLLFGYAIGIAVGAMLGYFGGKLDIIGQRVIEIWSSLPFLYTIIIISSIVVPIYMPGTQSDPAAVVLAADRHPRGL